MAPLKSAIRKRSIIIGQHKTSVSLEDAFWDALKDIARTRGVTLTALIEEVDRLEGKANLSSALRVFALEQQIRACRDRTKQ